jgi:hypothetical protein
MEIEKYLNYLDDKEVIRIPDGKTAFLKNKNLSIVITYLHLGTRSVWPLNPKNKRLIVDAYIGDIIPEIPTRIIGDETTLLLNSQEEHLAHTFILKINNRNTNVSLFLKDYPQCGLSLISEEEKNGLIYNVECK